MLLLALVALASAGEAGFDHAHAGLAKFLDGAVSEAGVDYGALAGRRAQLTAYLDQIAEADTAGWSNSQRLALYVNAYNAWTLATILDSGPPKSILDLDGGKVWDTRKFQVAGEQLTLNEIEHGRARKLADGRVHAALNCASKGCPPLPPTPLTATGQSAHLDADAARWVRTNAFRLDGTTVAVSKIFDWYGEDFVAANGGDIPAVDGKLENALWFLSRHADAATAAKLTSGSLTATWQDYDWSLNRR
jgi:hypothetical protein